MHNDKDFECFKCGYKTKQKSNLNRHLNKKKDCTSTEKLKPTTFEQSFASHPKAKHWHLTKNDKTPEHVFKATRDRFWFTCETCFHDFEISLCYVSPSNNRWCPYCSKTHPKFCDDDDCQFCFNNSFASCEKSNYWHPTKNGDLKPRNVSRMNDMKIWFRCNKCPHDFEGTVSHISKGVWCPYCSNMKRCSDSNCQMCLDNSVASNPNSIYWHPTRNGSLKPRDIARGSNSKYWFTCGTCCRDYKNRVTSIGCTFLDCKISFDNSFASNPYSIYWHSIKNGSITPREVAKRSSFEYWFTCNICCHEFKKALSHITVESNKESWGCPYCSKTHPTFCDDDDCQFCFKKSFASCEKSNYWHPTKNGDLKLRNVSRMSDMKIWFRCNECPHDFEATVSHITSGTWCPYCAIPVKKLCNSVECKFCFEKSFASNPNSIYWHSIKNGSITPRDVAKKTQETFWFSCDKCVHDFQHILSNDTWCPYCRGSKLCIEAHCDFCYKKSFASSEKSDYWHPTKNGDLKPRTICKSANVKAWFNCDRCLNPFIIWIPHIQERNGWCNICNHKTEHKLYESLIRYFPDIQMQFKAEWCKSSVTNYYYRFDFCIEEQRTIIELDGRQHFKDVAYFRSSFEERHFVDMIKQSAANNNGYKVIRILQEDVWSDKYDWLTELLKNIEDDTMPNIFMCKNEEYSIFQIDQNQDKQLFECDRRIDGYLGLTEFEDPNPNPPQKLKLTYDESDVIEQCVI